MFPLDEVYGPRAYRSFMQHGASIRSLKSTRQKSLDIFDDDPIRAASYTDLVDIVSFFSVMNKRQTLYFRGQGSHLAPIPTIFRPDWHSIGGIRHQIPGNATALQKIYDCLNDRISSIVLATCLKFPMPRKATLTMFREAVWAVAQHYELWPTPLVDITPNLRAAASFALLNGREVGNLYVFAMPPSTNSITFEADQHVVLARLQAVCPPVAKRPHYQDGFLVGRFPFFSPNPNQIDSSPSNVSNLSCRLVARILLEDRKDNRSSQLDGNFWNVDFPRMSSVSLMPGVQFDLLLNEFMPYATEIDEMMQDICRT